MLGSEEKEERSLMARLAMFCNGDKEQLLRVFRSSGQFRDDKPNAFYERMAGESMKFVERIQNENKVPMPNANNSGKRFGNAKT